MGKTVISDFEPQCPTVQILALHTMSKQVPITAGCDLLSDPKAEEADANQPSFISACNCFTESEEK